MSVDFDLFSPDPIPRTLLPKVKRVFELFPVQSTINNPDELTLLVNSVKVTFLTYPFPVESAFVTMRGLDLLSIIEIAATKAYSIGRRGTYKDYVDLYYMLKDRHASLTEIIAMSERKFGAEFNSRLFVEQLLFMDDISDYSIEYLGKMPTPSDILQLLRNEIALLPIAPEQEK